MSTDSIADTSDCHFCARQTDIEEHHIVPDRFNGRYIRENMVGVCERCHDKLERLYDKRFYERLGITDETGERTPHFECLCCSNRAAVHLSGTAWKDWFCLRCATARYAQRQNVTILTDTTGKMDNRQTWIDSVGPTARTTGGVA